uniref:subtilisin n=1 Tax=Amphora coffeiformis TaxID=265554 RepID=A0A7S3PDN0_9STRA
MGKTSLEANDTSGRGAHATKTAIRTRFSEKFHPSSVREMLWKLSLTFAILSLGTITTAGAAAELDDSVLREARILSAKNRSLAAYDCPLDEESGCQKVIVSFASAYGNTDPEFGTSDFERTNAKAMCVSQILLNSLLSSTEVLTVDCDAPVTTAVNTETTFENGEAIPWGADVVLQSQWDKIPDPHPSASPFVVCVVDSGLLVRHQDIPFSLGAANIEGAEFDLQPEHKWHNPVFYAYHGTHIAGIGFAEGYNGEGIRGIIPRSAKFKLLIARVFGDEMMPSARTSTIEKAVEWCADKGAKIINLSLASATPTLNSQRLYERIVTQEDILVVAASGNQGINEASYPAAYDHVMSVGSVDKDLQRSYFSQYGSSLDLVAPGADAYSTVPSSGIYDNESTRLDAGPMAFSPVPNDLIEGELSDCRNGDVVCSGAAGQVCLVEHLDALALSFKTIADNCENGGGVGLILFPGFGEDLEGAYMDLNYTGSISVVTVSRDDGLRLRAKRGTQASISFTVPAYRTVSGTSMAAAHVSALAAKLWAARPGCTNSQIRHALEVTALDLGERGRDDVYGHGLIQGAAAYDFLLDQPEPCGSPLGSGGFGPDGDPVRQTLLAIKTPHDEMDKTRICDPEFNPFCGNGPGGVAGERRGLRRLRGSRA